MPRQYSSSVSSARLTLVIRRGAIAAGDAPGLDTKFCGMGAHSEGASERPWDPYFRR